jgi:hypothetical protein
MSEKLKLDNEVVKKAILKELKGIEGINIDEAERSLNYMTSSSAPPPLDCVVSITDKIQCDPTSWLWRYKVKIPTPDPLIPGFPIVIPDLVTSYGLMATTCANWDDFFRKKSSANYFGAGSKNVGTFNMIWYTDNQLIGTFSGGAVSLNSLPSGYGSPGFWERLPAPPTPPRPFKKKALVSILTPLLLS